MNVNANIELDDMPFTAGFYYKLGSGKYKITNVSKTEKPGLAAHYPWTLSLEFKSKVTHKVESLKIVVNEDDLAKQSLYR